MKDKEIIDGINVMGCPHLIEDYQWWNIAGREEHDINRCALSFDDYRDFEEDDFCKENPNCYYKQLKRAENQIVELNKMVEAKEQECEELKKIIDEAKNSKLDLKSFLVGEAIQNEYEEQLDQLKQTLTEIKEIAEREVKRAPDGETFARPEIEQILHTISECEVTNDN
jgi:superfamily II DNA helicase RecQ